MGADIAISQDALTLIRSRSPDGEAMIATCRAVFNGVYDDEIYQSDLLDTFQLVCDETDNFILDGYGVFNSIHKPSDPVDAKNHREEIDAIFKFYSSAFDLALENFKKRFDI